MPKNSEYQTYTILAAGATKSFDVTEDANPYVISANGGAVTLLADMIFDSTGTPAVNDTFFFMYLGGVTAGAFRVVFFGVALTTAQALYKQQITVRYNGSSWDVLIVSDDTDASTDLDGGDLVNASVTNAKLYGEIALAKLLQTGTRGQVMRTGVNGVFETANAANAGAVLGGDGTDVLQQVVGGDLTKSGATWTIANSAVTTAKIADANVTVAKVDTSLKTGLITFPCSFETSEVGTTSCIIPYACTITNVRAVAIKTIAGTDAGTVTLKDNGGTTMTVTTPISFAASDALGTAYSSAITANNAFTAGQIMTVVTAKATVGGRVILELTTLRA